MTVRVPTIDDLRSAAGVIRSHMSAAPLIRSYPLERELGLSATRRAWIKDYGWTPVGSFKLLGALNWLAHHCERIGDRPIVAHSSGNFASGIAFAGMRYEKRVIVIMPETAPQIKFSLTRSFGAQIRTYDITTDHKTGHRDSLTREVAQQEQAVQASPYDDPEVIAGNGVGGLEIIDTLRQLNRNISHFVCQISGGGLMAGHALAIAHGAPNAKVVGVEPSGAADFCQSLQTGTRISVDKPMSICDGLLAYHVGEHNWPILRQHVTSTVAIEDRDTRAALRWLYQNHGLRTEPSGAITTAALLTNQIKIDGEGDLVVILSGRNADEESFQNWITVDELAGHSTRD